MTLESLEKLSDEELRQVYARATELLRQRDAERKKKAMADARALKEKAQSQARVLLESVGLSLKAVAPKKRRAASAKHGPASAQPRSGAARGAEMETRKTE
jgi:hypothetical protein